MKKSQTLIERACFSQPKFKQLYSKLQRHIEITGKSQSTLTNYSRCLATMTLHFGCNPVELDQEQVLDYLHYLKTQSRTPSSSYFKHTVYGLRFAYKVMGIEDKHVFLPALKFPKKLPVVLSYQQMRLLLKTPELLRHRVMLALMYGCGLRRFELLNIRLPDVDLQRGMLHIKEGKGRKDRYVPLSTHLVRGLRTYIEAERPYLWLFNGKDAHGQLQQFSATGVQWVISQAARKAGIQKHVTSHVLRHSYATHLLEMGMDIMTLKEVMGHEDIKSTLIYLHVARLGRNRSFSPLDKLYTREYKN
jgi:site-specific recombinase XerD